MLPQSVTCPAPAEQYSAHVNPQWVRLLEVLQMNVSYERCEGAELFTTGGRRILDFLSGYCVLNTGHNHPRIVAALRDELDRSGPAMLQSHVPENAGVLAERLCRSAALPGSGASLNKVFFCSSGSEGVETAIKFARARTGRSGLLCAEGAFHGLTCGALSLMRDPYWRDGFGPMLPDTDAVPFGEIEPLAKKLATKRFAAYIVEPIQAEGGVRIPPDGYLEKAQELCRRYGTLFVLDEVQTGMYRTGRFLAAHRFGVAPDMVILAKALSGGLVPVGAVLMTDAVYDSVYDSFKRAIVHTSTYSENGLSMRAGLAALDVLETENLGDRGDRLGDLLRQQLREKLSGFEMVKEIRGAGMLSGIEFRAPRALRLRVPFEAFRRIHEGMFGQVLVMRLFRDHNILTQICGNNFMVLKVAPPLMVTEAQMTEFVDAIHEVLDLVHGSNLVWNEALGLARRALNL
ncbi:MAG TPA: aspartate aminotransferase family protein [Bryobacteraceae bacterium]|nr:aspartate aminotransferase family protein [Bryobacteraceae bacterium]